MSDVTIEGTKDTIHFPPGMKPEEIAKVMATHPIVKKIHAKAANAANIAASMKSQGITPEAVKQKGISPAVEAAKTGHEDAASRARSEAALKATHDAQVYRLHGGGMGYNKAEQAKERAAAQQSSAKFQGLRQDPGTLLNQIQPHFDETLAQQQGAKGAIREKAAGLVNSLPDLLALAATEGLADIPEIAGQSLVTRGFQAQQVTGLAHEAADQDLRKKDPHKYYTSLLLGGLLAGAPDITHHAAKGLTKAVETPKLKLVESKTAEPAKVEPQKPPASPGVRVGRVTPKEKTPARPVETKTEPPPTSEESVPNPEAKKPELSGKTENQPKTEVPGKKPATQKPTAFVQTKVANDYTEQARASLGLDKLPDAIRQTQQAATDFAIKNGMHTERATREVAQRILSGGHAMSTEETVAAGLREYMIESRLKDLHEAITDGQKRGEDVDAKKVEAEELHEEYRNLTDATRRSGTQTAQALASRKQTVDEYSHVGIRKRLEDAVGPEAKVKPEVLDAATTIVKERDELVKKTAAKEKVKADRSDKESKDAGAEAVAKMKARTVVRADKRAELDEELKGHIARLVKVTSQLNVGVDPAIVPIVRDIAVNRLKVASLSAEALVDQVHAIVSEHLPDISKRDVRDAISGYGQDPQAAKRSQLTEIKTQLKLISEIEDARAGVVREQRIAAGRQKASSTVQALRKQRDSLKPQKATARPATHVKSPEQIALEKAKARVETLNKKMASGDVKRPPQLKTVDTEEMAAARKALTEAQQKFNAMRKAAEPPKTPAQTRLERLEKQFEQMKAKNAVGDYGKAPTRAPDTPEEAGMRAKLSAATRERGAMRKAQSATPPKDPFAAYKKAQQKRGAELQRQIDAGLKDMQKQKGPVVRDEEAEANKLEIKKKEKELDRLVKSQQPKAFQARLIAWRRFAALSRVGSLTKLGAAAGERMVFGPLEEVTGLPARYLTPNIERNAPTQGRPSLRAEGGALNKYFSKQTWTKEAVDKFRTGANSIDLKYGGKEDMEGANDAPTLLNLPGRLHGAIKTPAQLAAFERAQIKGTEWAERRGLDINDPLVQGGVDARAYQESLRAILMQDNTATNLYKTVIQGLERNEHPAGKATATAMRALMPIVKVPTNFAGEVGLHLGGAVRAAWEVKVAGGVKNLTPDQSDIVLRSLKKNGVGGMMFAIGYFNPDKFGGEYVSGRKRKPGDPEYGAIGSIPHNLLHNAAIEALQVGATWRKVQDDEIKKRAAGHPFLAPAWASTMGVAENIPFADFMKRGADVMHDPKSASKAVGQEAASMVIPGTANEVGALFNKDAQGKQIQRKPQGFWDEIKMAAGFQSTVPTANPSSRGGSLPKMNADGSIRALRAPRGSLPMPKL